MTCLHCRSWAQGSGRLPRPLTCSHSPTHVTLIGNSLPTLISFPTDGLPSPPETTLANVITSQQVSVTHKAQDRRTIKISPLTLSVCEGRQGQRCQSNAQVARTGGHQVEGAEAGRRRSTVLVDGSPGRRAPAPIAPCFNAALGNLVRPCRHGRAPLPPRPRTEARGPQARILASGGTVPAPKWRAAA